MFGRHWGHLPHLWNITVKYIKSKTLWWNKAKGSNVDLKPERTKKKKHANRTKNKVWSELSLQNAICSPNHVFSVAETKFSKTYIVPWWVIVMLSVLKDPANPIHLVEAVGWEMTQPSLPSLVRVFWRLSVFSLFWYSPFVGGKYQYKEKPLKHQRRLDRIISSPIPSSMILAVLQSLLSRVCRIGRLRWLRGEIKKMDGNVCVAVGCGGQCNGLGIEITSTTLLWKPAFIAIRIEWLAFHEV